VYSGSIPDAASIFGHFSFCSGRLDADATCRLTYEETAPAGTLPPLPRFFSIGKRLKHIEDR
jgi:hypothetical protein